LSKNYKIIYYSLLITHVLFDILSDISH